MQTRREYLAGLTPPLAIPGARGRLSKAALAEIERARSNGMTFSDDSKVDSVNDEIVPLPPAVYTPLPKQPVLRDVKSVLGYTDDGREVRSDICFRCSFHVKLCNCRDGIVPSPIVVRWAEESKPYGIPLDSPVKV